jgi:hypothetical protein
MVHFFAYAGREIRLRFCRYTDENRLFMFNLPDTIPGYRWYVFLYLISVLAEFGLRTKLGQRG